MLDCKVQAAQKRFSPIFVKNILTKHTQFNSLVLGEIE